MKKLTKLVEKQHNKRGIALISVLAILTLAAVMILAFFSLSRNELTSSTAYSHGIEAQQLAQTAVNIVIHQIRSASSEKNVAWASQPGMIRTWDQNGFKAGYKLYSDDEMLLERESEVFDDFKDLRDWDSPSNKVKYVDLNQPVLRENVGATETAFDQEEYETQYKRYYPIVDPRAKELEASDLSRSKKSVEGFDFELDNVAHASESSGLEHAWLPMPVKWLYQLADGTLGTLVGGDNRFQRVSGAGIPSRENPMVARIAFWTDDETCKVNINTAAGGRAWDTPRAAGFSDRDMGRFQPMQREYQRYPGHPATTSMLPILFPNQPKYGESGYDGVASEQVYKLTPRIKEGGSAGGTFHRRANPGDPPEYLSPKRDRLYATLDEFIFQAPELEFDQEGAIKSRDSSLPNQGRINQLQENFRNTRWKRSDPGNEGEAYVRYLDKLKFFLTAHSRAPETTVFNTPRISVWPTYNGNPSQDEEYFSSFDKRIRICTEVGDSGTSDNTSPEGRAQYYFQREKSGDRTYDYEQIARNKDLYEYMQWLTDQEVPGVGRSLKSKYGNETDQILTEIFDYIRCLNLFDDSLLEQHGTESSSPQSNNTASHIAFTNKRVKSSTEIDAHPGHGQVVPIEIGSTHGFGRIHSVMEVGIAFICCAEGTNTIGGRRRQMVNEYSHGDRGMQANNYQYSNICKLNPISPSKATEVYGALIPSSWMMSGQPMDQYWQSNDPQYRDSFGRTGKENWDLVRDQRNWNLALGENNILLEEEKLVQGMLLISLFSPSQGWTMINPDLRIEVDVSGMRLNDVQKLGRPTSPGGTHSPSLEIDGNHVLRTPFHSCRVLWGARDNGGVIEPRYLLMADAKRSNGTYVLASRYSPWNRNLTKTDEYGNKIYLRDNPEVVGNTAREGLIGNAQYFDDDEGGRTGAEYPLITRPIIVPKNEPMVFSGGRVEIRLYADDGIGSDPEDKNRRSGDYYQRVTINMDSCPMPTPTLVGGKQLRPVQNGVQEFTETQPQERWSLMRDGAFGMVGSGPDIYPNPQRGGRMKTARYWHGIPFLIDGSDSNHNRPGEGVDDETRWLGSTETDDRTNTGDVTRSYSVIHGDLRISHVTRELTDGNGSRRDNLFVKHPEYNNPNVAIASNFTQGNNSSGYGRDKLSRQQLVPAANFNKNSDRIPHLPDTYEDDYNRWGDWDNTMAAELDGPFINKPDEGNSRNIAVYDFNPAPQHGAVDREFIPYYTQPWTQEPAGPSYWSPNRIMPGPGMFGSLPTGVEDNEPWRTLLFRPLPKEARGTTGEVHPGFEDPKDHYFMDFFWMPVVEPWSISEPLSTAGKINMNYAIQPFAHITRSSGVRAVFASEEMLTVPNTMALSYTNGRGYGRGYNYWLDVGGDLREVSLRSWIDEEETLRQFQDKFEKGEIFRTASEMCELWLVPTPVGGLRFDAVLERMDRMWDPDERSGFGLTGDNSRERPYTNIVPRLTTKSNTFQVHYRAQVIRQSPLSPSDPSNRRSNTEYETFDPSIDEWVSEYRGSTILERYIDPEDPRIPDYATDTNAPALDNYYRFRVLSQQRFAP